MSWNFVVAGSDHARIKDEVRSNDRVPNCVRDVLCAAIDDVSGSTPLIVDCAGHLDANGGNVKFNIRSGKQVIVAP